MKLWLQEFIRASVTVCTPWRRRLAQWNRVPDTEMYSPQTKVSVGEMAPASRAEAQVISLKTLPGS